TQNFEAVARLRHDGLNLNGCGAFAIACAKSIERRGEVYLTSANLCCQSLFRQIAIQLFESLGHRRRIRHGDRLTVLQLYIDLAHLTLSLNAPKTTNAR